MGTHELRVRFWSIVSALSKPTYELLRMSSIEHVDGKSKDGNEALMEVLKGDKEALKLVKSLSKDNQRKFYDTKGILKSKVNIDELDVQFVKDLLLYVDGLPTARKTLPPICNVSSHTNCCSSCDHVCSKCKNLYCPTKKCCQKQLRCDHRCKNKNCNTNQSKCTVICCKSCNTCLNCHDRSGGSCDVYKLIEALKIANDLRNAAAHSSDEDFERFQVGAYRFTKFQTCNNVKSLSFR